MEVDLTYHGFGLDDPDLLEDMQPPPPILYHYTDAKGFFGIVESGPCLHATHHEFLNDVGEVRFGLDVVRAFFRRLGSELGEEVTSLLDTTIESLGHADSFIACLSKGCNVLSQWRAYADSGAGYCIGFSPTERLVGYGDDQVHWSTHLLECIYGRANLEERLSRRLSRERASLARQAFEDQPALLAMHLGRLALRYAHLAKHEHFQEELEWRFIVNAPANDVRYRVGARGLTPYLETENLSIKEVWVGPVASPSPQVALRTTSRFLAKHGITAKLDFWESPFRR